MPVPFFDIHYNLDEASRLAILGRWARVLEHGGFVNGPEVRELEAALRERKALRYQLKGNIASREPKADHDFEFESALNPVPGVDGVLR